MSTPSSFKDQPMRYLTRLTALLAVSAVLPTATNAQTSAPGTDLRAGTTAGALELPAAVKLPPAARAGALPGFAVAVAVDGDRLLIGRPGAAYLHQGWILDDHRHFYMNDEGDEVAGLVNRTRTLIWDIVDLDDPILLGEHLGSTAASDHNLYVQGRFMYQSNFFESGVILVTSINEGLFLLKKRQVPVS